MGKLKWCQFLARPHKRYTFSSGLIGGFFLALSYFGADQFRRSNDITRRLAQRGICLGLFFNAVVKVPMQFPTSAARRDGIMFTNSKAAGLFQSTCLPECVMENGYAPQLTELQTQPDDVFAQNAQRFALFPLYCQATRDAAMNKARELDAEAYALHDQTKAVLVQTRVDPKARNPITYLLLLFFNDAARSCRITHRSDSVRDHVGNGSNAKCSRLHDRRSIFIVRLIRANASDHHYVIAAQALTAVWGLIAIGVASSPA